MMKKYNIILIGFIIISFTGISQEEINQFDSEGKRHGIWKKTFDDSEQTRYTGEFNHGKEIGTFKFYCNDCEDQPTIIKTFNNNNKVAEVKYFTKKGKLVSEGKMKGKLRVGEWVYYHEKSNTIMTKEYYKEGVLDGNKSTFYKNNTLAEELNYSNGLKEGANIYYSPSGIVLKKLNYANDELDGLAIYYDASGKTVLEGNYKNGKKDGIWRTYKDGEFVKEEKFPKGKY